MANNILTVTWCVAAEFAIDRNYWSKKGTTKEIKILKQNRKKYWKDTKKNRRNCWREIKYWSTSHTACLRHSAIYVKKKRHYARCPTEALQQTTPSSGQVRGIPLCQHLTPQNAIVDKVLKSKNVDFSGQINPQSLKTTMSPVEATCALVPRVHRHLAGCHPGQ